MNRRLMYGTYSAVMALFFIFIFVLVNLLAGGLNISRDLTEERIYSLSDRSRSFLASLNQDVFIYPLVRTGNEQGTYLMAVMTQLLAEYEAASRFIKVEYRDPMLNPAFVRQYAAIAGIPGGISENSVIVESAAGVRIIFPHEMVSWSINEQTGEQIVRSINIESEITRAIHRVTTDNPAAVYYVTGSGEPLTDPLFNDFLYAEGFDLRPVNLTLQDVPPDADILFITMPARDWTEVKAERVLNYLENEGRAFFALDYTAENIPNMLSVLAAYGLGLGDYIILEGDSRRVFMGTPLYIIPNNETHVILENIIERGIPNVLAVATGIEILDVRRAGTEITPLWTTSRQAFGRVDPTAETFAQIPSDVLGPFNLAVAVTDQFFIDRTHLTRLVAVGNTAFLDEELNRRFVGGGNWEFVVSSLRWLHGRPAGIFIPPRVPPGTEPLVMNDFQANLIGIISLGVLPLIILGIGGFVWYKRRFS